MEEEILRSVESLCGKLEVDAQAHKEDEEHCGEADSKISTSMCSPAC